MLAAYLYLQQRVTLMRGKPLSHQYPKQIITRTHTFAGRGTTIPLIAVIACLPTLVCCSSVSNTFTALFESSRNSSPPETPAAPVLMASPPISEIVDGGGASPPHATARVTRDASAAAPATTPFITSQTASSPPSENPKSPTVPVATPAAPAISDDFDAAASVYPSVALFDEIRKSRDAQLSSQSLSPSNLSDSSAPTTPLAATSHPPPTTLPGSGPTAAAAPLASAASNEFDAAASVYPSVALFDLIRKSRDSQLSSQTASPPILSESSAPAAPATLAGQRTPTP